MILEELRLNTLYVNNVDREFRRDLCVIWNELPTTIFDICAVLHLTVKLVIKEEEICDKIFTYLVIVVVFLFHRHPRTINEDDLFMAGLGSTSYEILTDS